MGGAAVSSSNTGAFKNEIELNAVQRSNPEMQKRVANTIRSLIELEKNPIISIHDHGAGVWHSDFSFLEIPGPLSSIIITALPTDFFNSIKIFSP